MDKVPAELVINWDQTDLNYVPVSQCTMAQEGAKRMEIDGKDNKRQITAVFGYSMSGDCLPPQLVYQGKTAKCFYTILSVFIRLEYYSYSKPLVE